jgi:hypothetical protein
VRARFKDARIEDGCQWLVYQLCGMWSDSEMPEIEMMDELKQALAKLQGSCVSVRAHGSALTPEHGSVMLEFASGEWLSAAYWRVLGGGVRRLSSFDHGEQYGLPAPIDAIGDLREVLRDRKIAEARLDERTGDVMLEFEGGVTLQVMNFSGNEVWEFRFLSGGGAWSNYA